MDTGGAMGGARVLAAAMAATALGGGGLGLFLLLRARGVPGARPLAAFLAIAGLWATGLALPGRLGAALLALAPLGGAVFVHFAVRLSGRGTGLILWAYAAGGGAMLAAFAGTTGTFVPWSAGGTLFRYAGAGLWAAGVTLILAGLGHALLLAAWRRVTGKRRRQIGVVIASSALGLAATSALAFPLLGIDAFPWPLLLLPLYIAVLAYGVLRYELMTANRWARRALTWGILVAAAAGVTAAPVGWMAAGSSWGVSAAAVAVALALWTPVRRLVDRTIFPGGEVSAAEIAAWRAALGSAGDEAEIARIARSLLRQRLGIPDGKPVDPAEAPPGPRRIIEVMATIGADARRDLDRRRAFAERQRLAELGALAATIAHDLRNPMNIIGMAVAESEPAVRGEVKTQLARMEALVRDLLDYAKPWAVNPADNDVAAAVADAAKGMEVTLDVPAGLTVRADPLRLGQALGNLLSNARAAGGRVLAAAEPAAGAVLIHVCDDGTGIPEDIRSSLFQPFVSRGRDGTGLGLAIVAKVMAAHGGAVWLGDRAGWTTCFTMRFPA